MKVFNIRKNEVFDADALAAEWGISPEQVVDFQALVGDSVDNVPGVPLIGPKFAGNCWNKYGTLEAVLDHADEVPKGEAEGEPARSPRSGPVEPRAGPARSPRADRDRLERRPASAASTVAGAGRLFARVRLSQLRASKFATRCPSRRGRRRRLASRLPARSTRPSVLALLVGRTAASKQLILVRYRNDQRLGRAGPSWSAFVRLERRARRGICRVRAARASGISTRPRRSRR